MRKILVTRAVEDYPPTAKKLAGLGFEAAHAPMLKFTPKTFEHIDFTGISALVFTSANGVRALKASAQFEKFKSLPCYAVGQQSAQLAKDSGFKLWGQGQNDVVSLAKFIEKDYKLRKLSKPLLHISGVHWAGNLSTSMSKVTIIINHIQAYEMISKSSIDEKIKHAFMTKQIEAILLYSSRSANIFIENMKEWNYLHKIIDIPIFCLSKNIADSICSPYLKRIHFVNQPDEMKLLELMQKELKDHI